MLELIHLQPLRQKYLFSMECTWSSPNSLRTPMCTGKPGAGGWRTCRLWSAEQGSTEFPQDFLPIWGKQKSQGHSDWRCSFNTFTQRKSQDYYLHPSWGCSEPGEVPSLLPGAQWARESRAASTCYKLVGVEVTNFSQAQLWMNILKDALEKARQEFVAGNLSSGLYLNVQTFDASRVFIL